MPGPRSTPSVVRPRVEQLETRDTPSTVDVALAHGGFAVGRNSEVELYGPSGTMMGSMNPFPGFQGSLRVTQADVTGDGTPDLVVGTGPGAPPQVKVYDGSSGNLLSTFRPFESSFIGGVFVAAADFNKDGRADVVVSPDEGGGPVVSIYDGASLAQGGQSQLARFLGIADRSFRGGARVATGDLDSDGNTDLIIAAGIGGGPRISILDGPSVLSNSRKTIVPDFFAFEAGLRNGAYVASADLNGDGYDDLVFGAGPGGGPRVMALSGRTIVAGGTPAALSTPIADFFAGDGNDRSGISVTTFSPGQSRGPSIIASDSDSVRMYPFAPPPAVSPTRTAATAVSTPATTTTTTTTPVSVPLSSNTAGERVLAYAQSNLGRVVNTSRATGCAALADAALLSAGAKSQRDLGNAGPIANHYVWGQPIFQLSKQAGYSNFGTYADIQPGDILQFDLYSEVTPGESVAIASHHTAVVESVDPTTGEIKVIQQNYNGDAAARRGSYEPNWMTGGVVTAYRPIPA